MIAWCLAACLQDPYAIVVSKATREDAAWGKAVDALQKKRKATVVVYEKSVDEARGPLAKLFPRYACFVARPEEAGRDFVVAVHRLTRALDDDPYTDVLWGILTGYEAADATAIVETESLTVRRGSAGTGLDLGAFEEGVTFSEGEKGVMWEKKKGGEAQKQTCPDDSTKSIVDMLLDWKPDLFLTSGHATQRDWQIGYSYKNGQLRCEKGRLYGLDTKGARFDVASPNPKVYLASGNCLAGLIDGRDAMAVAWMHSGGARQMVGYVVSTWFGYGGWGVNDYFIGQGGRHTLAESFYLNNQALVHQLETRFPKTARANFEEWEIERDESILNRFAEKHRCTEKDELGLLWDRDTVALYGDPAFEARLAKVREPAWEQTLTEKDGAFTFEVVAKADTGFGRPPAALLPYRVRDVKVTAGTDLRPLIADNFILVPPPAALKKGESFKVEFAAKKF